MKDGLPKIDVKDLPSKFLPYPEGVKISYRPFTYGDLLKINQSKLHLGSLIREILDGIETEGINKLDLTYFDFLFIALLRKVSNPGSDKFVVKWRCSCGHSNRSVILCDQFDFEYIQAPELPVTITLSDSTELEFSPLTVRDFLSLCDKGKSFDELYLFSSQVRNLPLDKALNLIDNAYGEDSELLAEVDRLLYHGLKPIRVQCSSCKVVKFIEISDTEVIICPFRGSEEPARNRIRFGKKGNS